MRKRYVASKRHTIQVDFDDYLHALAQGAQGGRRARARGRASRCRWRRARRRAARGGRHDAPRPASASASAPRRPTARRSSTPRASVFGDIGYGAARVRDIVRGTDLATGTFYNYFPDKESVLRALVDEIAVEARARVRAARHGRDDARGVRRRRLPRLLRVPRRGPATRSRCMRRNAGTIRDDVRRARARARASTSCARTSRRPSPPGRIPPHDADLMAAAMVGRRRRGRPAHGRARAARRRARGGLRHRRVPGCV